MRLGLILSLTIHITLLAWMVLSIERMEPINIPETVAVSVAVVNASDVTRMKQGDQNTKTLESKAADKPSEDDSQKEAPKPKAAQPAAATPPPPPPESEPVKPDPPKPDPPKEVAALPPEKTPPEPTPPPPDPGPTPDEQAALAAKLEAEQKAAEENAKAEAEKKRKEAEAEKKRKLAEAEKKKKLAEAAAKAKAEAEKKKFDANKLADLINKADDGPQKALIDKSAKPSGAKPMGDSKTATNLGPSAGTKEGRDTVLSAREADMLNSLLDNQLKGCWRLPAGGGGTETPVVVLSWNLKPDGSLDGEPRVVKGQNTPLFQLAAEAAIRAVKSCSPFQLPPDKYTNWREIRSWAFDPSKML